MDKSIDIFVDKLYRNPRLAEPCFIGIPVKAGTLMNTDRVVVFQEGKPLPIQKKVTSTHKDGSVRFLFLRFLADLPANKGTQLVCDMDSDAVPATTGLQVTKLEKGIAVDTGALSFEVQNGSNSIFANLDANSVHYNKEQFVGPLLKGENQCAYDMKIGDWQIAENGSVCVILTATGTNVIQTKVLPAKQNVDFALKLTAYAGKPWVEVSYRIINTTPNPLKLEELAFNLDVKYDKSVIKINTADQEIFTTEGVSELEKIQNRTPVSEIRTCAASSNYKTSFAIGKAGAAVTKVVDAKSLVYESNEHAAEVFYGTFFADRTDENGGVCATIFQAQQNYPKAVCADQNGIRVMLVPEGIGEVVMESGMSREQKFLLHFHAPDMPIEELDNRSLIYQMPDRPYVKPEVHKNSGCYIDIFTDKFDMEAEQALIAKADGHASAYGMLNFGDSPDMNYTTQGRGGGELVWSNNEYDFPHACALLYVRNATRRFLDYNIAAVSHWMDVDVCHFSTKPLFLGGQWEHTNGHCKGNVISRDDLMVCSHQWVEGLLDYYHFTGDERGFETAIGIGKNVLGLLDTPAYAQVGETNARETGWALRTLTALYVETHDKKWLAKSEKIVEDFKVWAEQYGDWLAPYTDNTVIRVGFMISVAVGSLIRYYREFPDDELKALMLKAVDDLIENCYVERTGLFYYKELPSLDSLGSNTLLLESLVVAYELTGDKKYLKYGEQTFKKAIRDQPNGSLGKKTIYGDAVVAGSGSTKNFGQSFIPLATYYKALMETCNDFDI